MGGNKVIIEAKLDTKSFDAQIEKLEDKLDTLEQEYNAALKDANFPKEELIKYRAEIERTSNQIKNLYKQQLKVNSTKYDRMKSSIDNVGDSVSKVVNKVARWGLAIFGIRSAYNAVRQAMSTLTQYDDTMKANVDYIRYALATALKPLIEWIINAVYKLMFYINYIAKAWFGIDLFANASVKAFNSANREAKKLQKTLAGFDEMNVLNKNGTTGIANATPSFDLSSPENIPIPDWIKWIADHKDEVIGALAGIAGGLLAIKTGIKGLGVGIAIAGIIKAIKNLIEFLKNPTFDNFIGVLEGIALAAGGVAIAIGAWPVAIGAAVALAVIEIVKHFDEIKEVFKNLTKWIDTDFRKKMEELFGPIGTFITEVFLTAIDFIRGAFESFYGGIKKIVEGIVKIFQGDFFGGISDIFEGLFNVMQAPFNALRSVIEGLWERIKKPIETVVNKIKKALGFKVEMEYNFSAGDGGEGASGSGSSGGGYRAKGGIFYPSKLPKLAVGGIINNPGAGVPYNGAIIGERGAEAVVPLTDSQQMALLGEAIGRYITVQLTNVTELDGRTIARKVQEVNNNTNFLTNR